MPRQKTKPAPAAPVAPRDPIAGIYEDVGMWITMTLNNYERARTRALKRIDEGIADPLFGLSDILEMARHEHALRLLWVTWGAESVYVSLTARLAGVRKDVLSGYTYMQDGGAPDSVAIRTVMFRGARDFMEAAEGILAAYNSAMTVRAAP